MQRILKSFISPGFLILLLWSPPCLHAQDWEAQKRELEAQQNALRNEQSSLENRQSQTQNELNSTRAELNSAQSTRSTYQANLRCSNPSECQQKGQRQTKMWAFLSMMCGVDMNTLLARSRWIRHYRDETNDYRPLIETLQPEFDLFSWKIPAHYKVFRSSASGLTGDQVIPQTETIYGSSGVSQPTLAKTFFEQMLFHGFGKASLPMIAFGDGKEVPPSRLMSLCFLDGTPPQILPELAEFEIKEDSGLQDFEVEAQSAIFEQYWKFRMGQGFSPYFKNKEEYENRSQEELAEFFRKIVHSTIYFTNRSFNSDREETAKHFQLLHNVQVTGSSTLTLHAGKRMILKKVDVEPYSRLSLTADQNIRVLSETRFPEGSEVVLSSEPQN